MSGHDDSLTTEGKMAIAALQRVASRRATSLMLASMAKSALTTNLANSKPRYARPRQPAPGESSMPSPRLPDGPERIRRISQRPQR